MRQRLLSLTREFAESSKLDKSHKMKLFSFVVEAEELETGQGFSLPELWSKCKFPIFVGTAPHPFTDRGSIVTY